jgi:hypothetical protein
MQLVLDIERNSDLDLLLPLLNRLQIRFVTQNDAAGSTVTRSKLTASERAAALRVIAEGCDVSNFGDALTYQKEIRTDRSLPFRD